MVRKVGPLSAAPSAPGEGQLLRREDRMVPKEAKEEKMPRTYTLDEAREIADKLAIDFESAGFDVEQFLAGLDVEAEHGGPETDTNVTDDDGLTTGKIALAHLREMPDYYARLEQMEGGEATKGGSLMRKLVIAGAVAAAALVVFAVVCTNIRRHRAAPAE